MTTSALGIVLKSILTFAMNHKIIDRMEFEFKIPRKKKARKVEVFNVEERRKIYKN